MICKKCGAELGGDERFCGICGAQAESNAVKCGCCGKYFDREYNMCPFCGTEIAEESVAIQESAPEDEAKCGYACPKGEAGHTQNARVCPYCSYKTEAGDHSVEKGDIYEGDACESCAEKNESRQAENTNNETDLLSANNNNGSKYKWAIIGGIIAAIVIILLIVIISEANSGYTCSECGKRVREGYTVFGRFFCEDCFM